MTYTSEELYNFIEEENLESDFLNALMFCVNGYTISEIPDCVFCEENGQYRLKSDRFSIDVEIIQDDIITAIMNKLYISSFVSKKDSTYNVHFLVHPFPTSMKKRFDDNIVTQVIHYMIVSTIDSLGMDTHGKVRAYINSMKGIST